MSYTPGPWRFERAKWNTPEYEKGAHSIGSVVSVEQSGEVGYYVARIDNADGDMANAHLIAAAPLMFQALKWATDWLDEYEGECMPEWRDWANRARAAIVAAEPPAPEAQP